VEGAAMASKNLTVEGEKSKRCLVYYDGEAEPVAECDTPQEAWARYRHYEENIRPVKFKSNPYQYRFRIDGSELDVVQFRAVINAEKNKL
jgi:hypothetical protein